MSKLLSDWTRKKIDSKQSWMGQRIFNNPLSIAMANLCGNKRGQFCTVKWKGGGSGCDAFQDMPAGTEGKYEKPQLL